MKNIKGLKFNRLTAIEYLGRNKFHHNVWLFQCECGNYKEIEDQSVLSGHTMSCGCYNREILASGDCRRQHGMHGTRIYRIWKGIHNRCKHPIGKSKCYKDVSYCKEWEHFEPFYEWAMKNGYRDDLTIDRIDNSKGYSPDNCRWATVKEQANNKTTTKYVLYKGEKQTLSYWSEKYRFNKVCFYQRVKRGESEEETIEYYARKCL